MKCGFKAIDMFTQMHQGMVELADEALKVVASRVPN